MAFTSPSKLRWHFVEYLNMGYKLPLTVPAKDLHQVWFDMDEEYLAMFNKCIAEYNVVAIKGDKVLIIVPNDNFSPVGLNFKQLCKQIWATIKRYKHGPAVPL